jgi:predicted acyltransferase
MGLQQISKPSRDESLDVLRGLALAGMLLVNNPGSWSHVFTPLLHATWHGLTPTDLVFPFFIFVVGGAMSFSFKKAIESRCFNWLNIIRRTFLLIGIGVLLNAFPFQISFNDLRFPGVLPEFR